MGEHNDTVVFPGAADDGFHIQSDRGHDRRSHMGLDVADIKSLEVINPIEIDQHMRPLPGGDFDAGYAEYIAITVEFHGSVYGVVVGNGHTDPQLPSPLGNVSHGIGAI